MKKITTMLAVLALFCLVNCNGEKRVDIDKITLILFWLYCMEILYFSEMRWLYTIARDFYTGFGVQGSEVQGLPKTCLP